MKQVYVGERRKQQTINVRNGTRNKKKTLF